MPMFTYSLACAELVGVQLPRQMASSPVLLNLAIVYLTRQSSKRVKTTIMITDASKVEQMIIRSLFFVGTVVVVMLLIVMVVGVSIVGANLVDSRYQVCRMGEKRIFW